VTVLFRVCKNNPPTLWDFKSLTQRGRTPPSIEEENDYNGVSVLESIELARELASLTTLGDHIAELEVPDSIRRISDGSGHVDLMDTLPEQLMDCVIGVHAKESSVKA
jgi:hypothetical protein